MSTTEKPSSPDRSTKESEVAKEAAAKMQSPRMARRGYDPQICRQFAEWDR